MLDIERMPVVILKAVSNLSTLGALVCSQTPLISVDSGGSECSADALGLHLLLPDPSSPVWAWL